MSVVASGLVLPETVGAVSTMGDVVDGATPRTGRWSVTSAFRFFDGSGTATESAINANDLSDWLLLTSNPS